MLSSWVTAHFGDTIANLVWLGEFAHDSQKGKLDSTRFVADSITITRNVTSPAQRSCSIATSTAQRGRSDAVAAGRGRWLWKTRQKRLNLALSS